MLGLMVRQAHLTALRAALFLAGAGSALACRSWDPTPPATRGPEDPRLAELSFDRPWTGFEGSSVGGYTLEPIGSLAGGSWSRERPSFSVLHEGRRVYWGQCEQASAEARTLGEVPERLVCVLRAKAPGFEDASLVLTGDGTDPLAGWLWSETERFRVGTRSAEGVFALSHVTGGLEVRSLDDQLWLVVDEMTSMVRRVRVHEATPERARRLLLPLALVFGTWQDRRALHRRFSSELVAGAFVKPEPDLRAALGGAVERHAAELRAQGQPAEADALERFARTVDEPRADAPASPAVARLYLSVGLGADGLGSLAAVRPGYPARDLRAATTVRAQVGLMVRSALFVAVETQAAFSGGFEPLDPTQLGAEEEPAGLGQIGASIEWLPMRLGAFSPLFGGSAAYVLPGDGWAAVSGWVLGLRAGLHYELIRLADRTAFALIVDARWSYASLRPHEPSSPVLREAAGILPGGTISFRFTL